jgi:hypothetical protein
MNKYEISTIDGDVYYYNASTYLQAAMLHFEATQGKLDGPWCVTNLDNNKQEIVEQQTVIALAYYSNNYTEAEETWVLSE